MALNITSISPAFDLYLFILSYVLAKWAFAKLTNIVKSVHTFPPGASMPEERVVDFFLFFLNGLRQLFTSY